MCCVYSALEKGGESKRICNIAHCESCLYTTELSAEIWPERAVLRWDSEGREWKIAFSKKQLQINWGCPPLASLKLFFFFSFSGSWSSERDWHVPTDACMRWLSWWVKEISIIKLYLLCALQAEVAADHCPPFICDCRAGCSKATKTWVIAKVDDEVAGKLWIILHLFSL